MANTPVKEVDSSAFKFALLTATVMIAHQVAGKATRDAMFLSHFEVTELPKAVVGAAILSVIAVLTMSRLLARRGPHLLVPAAFGISGVLFIGEWWLFKPYPETAAIVLYLHIAVFGALLISGFWSVINERFDPHEAKVRVAKVAAAAALGGVVGGLLAEQVATLIDLRAMLLVLGALHLFCVFGINGIGHSKTQIQSGSQVRSGLEIIAKTRYLQQMAVLVILIATVASLVDYAFKSEAAARFDDDQALITFFARFYAGVGLLTFLLQSTMGPKILQRFGISTTIAVLPTLVLLGGMLSAVITHVWTLLILRGGQSVLSNSFFRSAFELLYTPIPPPQKRPTKTIIDVACERFGDMLGGGLILLLLAISPNLPVIVVLILAIIAAILALFAVSYLNHGYIEQLARSLRKGAVSLDKDDIQDATTQHIFAETTVYAERELLMARIREHRHARSGQSPPLGSEEKELPDAAIRAIEAGSPSVIPTTKRVTSHSDLLAATVGDLTSDDVQRNRHALRGDFMDASLVAHIIPHLANDELAEDARMELRWLAPRVIGQITDALLDPDLPLSVRQRLPGVLEVCHNPRSIDGLVQGLIDNEFNIRYSCARALARMRSRNEAISVPEALVFAAVNIDVSVDRKVWRNRVLALESNLSSDVPDYPSNSSNTSLEHVFTVLSLCLEPKALQLAAQAIHSSDRNLRGTALEYLENVLPEDIRDGLWHQIGVRPSTRKTTSRTRRELIKDLLDAGSRLGPRR